MFSALKSKTASKIPPQLPTSKKRETQPFSNGSELAKFVRRPIGSKICYITYAAIAYCKKKQIALRALKKQLEKNSESYGIKDDADNT